MAWTINGRLNELESRITEDDGTALFIEGTRYREGARTRLPKVESGLEELKAEVAGLKAELAELKAKHEELLRLMGDR